MTYESWEKLVPDEIRSDRLWRIEAYRLGLFLSDLAWADVNKLLKDKRTARIADQLYRATGKISSNIAEAYSRHTGKDRALFYDYASGSARESRDWYYKARHVLGTAVIEHRLDLTTRLVRLLITMSANDRKTNRLTGASVPASFQASGIKHQRTGGA